MSHGDIAKRNTIFQDFRQLLLKEIPGLNVLVLDLSCPSTNAMIQLAVNSAFNK